LKAAIEARKPCIELPLLRSLRMLDIFGLLSAYLQGGPKDAVVRLSTSIIIPGSSPTAVQRVEQDGILLAVEGGAAV
jgi:hypothetical protein